MDIHKAEENLLARSCQDLLSRYITQPKLVLWSLGGSIPSLQTLVPAKALTNLACATTESSWISG